MAPVMAQAIDTSDVPLVAPEVLALPIRHLIDTGRGLAMLKGMTDAELRNLDHAMWETLGDDPARRVAVLLRIRCLIRVFGARRLADVLLTTGYNAIMPAVYVAARMRLNAQWGFNPMKFERALQGLLVQMGEPQPVAERRIAPAA